MAELPAPVNLGVGPESLNVPSDRILVIGNIVRWTSEGRMGVALKGFHFIGISSLTAETMQSFAPDIVLSPLFDNEFDVLDIAEKLHDLYFDGIYRVISDNLPNPDIVRNEVCLAAPRLDFDILLIPKQTDAV